MIPAEILQAICWIPDSAPNCAQTKLASTDYIFIATMTIAKLALSKDSTLRRIRTLTRLTDGLIPIPGLKKKIGLDPIIGLFTGGGDALGFVMSTYIVLESLRYRLPKETLLRMLSNVAIDAVAGTIPFLGDLFDFVWGANAKNLQLLEAHLENPTEQTAADRHFVLLILLGLAAILAIAVVSGVMVAHAIGSFWTFLFR
jgi:Domain of unknown function (DUF4112)